MVERRLSLAALAAASLLLGCAGAPLLEDGHRPAMPADRPFEQVVGVTPTPPLVVERWWLVFEDAQLHEQINTALAQNADLAVASARLRAARAQLDQVSGAQWPRLDVEATSGRSRVSADASTGTARLSTSHRALLTTDYEVDLWGRLASGTQAASQRLQAQSWARAAVEWSLTAQVAEAHFALRAVSRQLEIARAVQQGRTHEVALRRAQVSAGSGAVLELRRAEAELAAAEATLANLSRRQLALQSALALLTGRPLQALVHDSGPAVQPLEPTRTFMVRLPEGALAELLARRPDVRQAEAELLATKADVAVARASTLPAVWMTGSVGSDVRELSNLFSGPGFAWSLAAGVVHSLFDGGQARARVRESEALSEAATARYQRTVANAVVEVREAYLSVQVDADVLRSEQQRVASLAQALQLARIGQEAGVSTQLDTLDAQRNHFQAQLAEVDAYRARLVGQVAAFKALGGGHALAAASLDEPNRKGAP